MAGATRVKRRVVPPLLLGLMAFPGAPAQGAESPFDDWQFTLTPYLWLTSVDGQLTFDVTVKAGDILENVDFGCMGTGEVRKGDAVFFTDFIYLNPSNDSATDRAIVASNGLIEIPADAYTKTGVNGFVWTLGVGYALVHERSATLDVFVGFRDLQLKGDLDWQFAAPLGLFPQSGRVSDTAVVWDALIGVRGSVGLGQTGRWSVPYYFDVGFGSQGTTWQALVGVAYAFQWGDVNLSYRHLAYRTDNRLIEDVHFTGPALGATFRF